MLEPSMGKIAKSVQETNKIQFDNAKIRYDTGLVILGKSKIFFFSNCNLNQY